MVASAVWQCVSSPAIINTDLIISLVPYRVCSVYAQVHVSDKFSVDLDDCHPHLFVRGFYSRPRLHSFTTTILQDSGPQRMIPLTFLDAGLKAAYVIALHWAC